MHGFWKDWVRGEGWGRWWVGVYSVLCRQEDVSETFEEKLIRNIFRHKVITKAIRFKANV